MKREDFFKWAFKEIIIRNAGTKNGDIVFTLLKCYEDDFEDWIKKMIQKYLDKYQKFFDPAFVPGDLEIFIKELMKAFKKILKELKSPISREEFFSAKNGSLIVDANGKDYAFFVDEPSDPEWGEFRSIRLPEWGSDRSTCIDFGCNDVIYSNDEIIAELNYPGVKIIPPA